MHFDKGGIYGLVAGAFVAMLAVAFGYGAEVLDGLAVGFAWLEEHEELAGWAQAVGAVMAIAAGFGVAAWQHRLSDKAQAQAQDARRQFGLTAALHVGEHALEILKVAADFLSDPIETPSADDVEIAAKRIDGVVWQIDRTDFSEVRSLAILADVVQLRVLLLQAAASLRNIYGGSGVLQARLAGAASLIPKLTKTAGKVFDRLSLMVDDELG